MHSPLSPLSVTVITAYTLRTTIHFEADDVAGGLEDAASERALSSLVAQRDASEHSRRREGVSIPVGNLETAVSAQATVEAHAHTQTHNNKPI